VNEGTIDADAAQLAVAGVMRGSANRADHRRSRANRGFTGA
jgi:hypothetical protein